ncbi:MAG: FtsQ-type POTRA domain-containing protein [Oligoflexia bacterium]|nr:FtsQ-type POTRA domain-containing protein [Oligoflexia bacterium]
MRFILTFLLFIAVTGVFLWRPPKALVPAIQHVEQSAQDFLEDKEVQLSGLELLDAAEVRKLLPMQNSFAWWRLNGEEVERQLERHALIQAARVRPCGATSLRCFLVEIRERKPAFLAKIGEKIWLLGADGGFMSPVPPNRVAAGLEVAPGQKAIWVKGLGAASPAPEAVRLKLQYVRKLVDLVEGGVPEKVSEVELMPSGETAVRFQGLGFVAIFDVDSSSDATRITDEAARLQKLLQELGPRKADLAKVDLAFNKMAVVTMKP